MAPRKATDIPPVDEGAYSDDENVTP